MHLFTMLLLFIVLFTPGYQGCPANRKRVPYQHHSYTDAGGAPGGVDWSRHKGGIETQAPACAVWRLRWNIKGKPAQTRYYTMSDTDAAEYGVCLRYHWADYDFEWEKVD